MHRFLYGDFVSCNLSESFISSNNFWMESSGFPVYNNMTFTNRGNFTFSILIWITFISFPCLIALVRTYSVILNESGKRGHSCLVPDLTGRAFNFSPLSMMLVVGLSYVAFIMLRYVPFIHDLKIFVMKGFQILLNAFSPSIEKSLIFCGSFISFFYIFIGG